MALLRNTCYQDVIVCVSINQEPRYGSPIYVKPRHNLYPFSAGSDVMKWREKSGKKTLSAG